MKTKLILTALSLPLGAVCTLMAGAQQVPSSVTTPPGFNGIIKLDVRDSKPD